MPIPNQPSIRSMAQQGRPHKSNGQGKVRKPRHLDGRTREGRAARARNS